MYFANWHLESAIKKLNKIYGEDKRVKGVYNGSEKDKEALRRRIRSMKSDTDSDRSLSIDDYTITLQHLMDMFVSELSDAGIDSATQFISKYGLSSNSEEGEHPFHRFAIVEFCGGESEEQKFKFAIDVAKSLTLNLFCAGQASTLMRNEILTNSSFTKEGTNYDDHTLYFAKTPLNETKYKGLSFYNGGNESLIVWDNEHIITSPVFRIPAFSEVSSQTPFQNFTHELVHEYQDRKGGHSFLLKDLGMDLNKSIGGPSIEQDAVGSCNYIMGQMGYSIGNYYRDYYGFDSTWRYPDGTMLRIDPCGRDFFPSSNRTNWGF